MDMCQPQPCTRQYSHTDTHTQYAQAFLFFQPGSFTLLQKACVKILNSISTINGSTFGSCSMLQCSCLLVMFAPVRLTISGFSSLGPGRETYFRGPTQIERLTAVAIQRFDECTHQHTGSQVSHRHRARFLVLVGS